MVTKHKTEAVLLLLIMVLTAITGCETATNPDMDSDGNDSTIMEGSYTFPDGSILIVTQGKTLTFIRLPLDGTTRDYRGTYTVVDGMFLVMVFTHAKTPTATEFLRLSQTQILHAVIGNNQDIDLLPRELRNTSRVNHIANTISEGSYVYETGMVVHFGADSILISRLALPMDIPRDFTGIYKIIADKYIVVILQNMKEEPDKQMERIRGGIVIYGIYDDKSNTLGLYTGVIPSSGFYPPR